MQRSSITKIVSILLLLLFICFTFVSKSISASPTPLHRAKKIAAICQGQQQSCYTEQFTRLIRQFTLSYTLQILEEMQKTEDVQEGCHFIAHVIATEEVKKKHGNWEDVIAQVPANDCTGGFIMGAIEGYKAYDATFKLNAQVAPTLCQHVSTKSQAAESDQTCAHTIGHLFLIEKQGNVDETIHECTLLPSKYQYECFAGVFMENLFRRNLLTHGVSDVFAWNEKTFQKQKDLCNSYTDSQQKACWRELSHMILSLAKKDMTKVTQICSFAEDTTLQTACVKHARDTLSLLANPE